METGAGSAVFYGDQIKEHQDRIRQALARSGLAYHEGGIVLAGGQAPPVANLNDVLRRRDLPALDVEFKRALNSLESDPLPLSLLLAAYLSRYSR